LPGSSALQPTRNIIYLSRHDNKNHPGSILKKNLVFTVQYGRGIQYSINYGDFYNFRAEILKAGLVGF
jgi:hypothetical protein